MFKKIRLAKKLMKIVDAVEEYYKGNRGKIEASKEAIGEIKGYITDLERIIKRLGK
jgi:hypothetical protein